MPLETLASLSVHSPRCETDILSHSSEIKNKLEHRIAQHALHKHATAFLTEKSVLATGGGDPFVSDDQTTCTGRNNSRATFMYRHSREVDKKENLTENAALSWRWRFNSMNMAELDNNRNVALTGPELQPKVDGKSRSWRMLAHSLEKFQLNLA